MTDGRQENVRRGHSLLGLAAGDTLGAGYEGLASVEVDDPDQLMPIEGALYSDDTQQALVLAVHLLRNGEVIGSHLANELVALDGGDDRPSVYRGLGPGFKSFLEHVAEGAGDAAAQPSAGVGAAMRSAPIAIYFDGRPDEMRRAAIASSLVTHADPRAIAAAGAMTAAMVASGSGLRGQDLIYAAAAEAAEVEHELFEEYFGRLSPGDSWHTMSEAIDRCGPLLDAPLDVLLAAIGLHASKTAYHPVAATDPYAPASVTTAIVLAARFGDQPIHAVRLAVSLGGDTDTIAAMVGAITAAGTAVDWPWEIPNHLVLGSVGKSLAAGVMTHEVPDIYALEAALVK